MKTTKLQKAVLQQLTGSDELNEEALETLSDVSTYGASAGFGGFIYYSDTCKLIEKIRNDWQDFGYTSFLNMVQSFNCLKGLETEVEEFFICPDKNKDYTQIENALAWYALEETARELTDE